MRKPLYGPWILTLFAAAFGTACAEDETFDIDEYVVTTAISVNRTAYSGGSVLARATGRVHPKRVASSTVDAVKWPPGVDARFVVRCAPPTGVGIARSAGVPYPPVE